MQTVEPAAGWRGWAAAVAFGLISASATGAAAQAPAASVARVGDKLDVRWTPAAPGGMDIIEMAPAGGGPSALGQSIATGAPGLSLELPAALFGPHPIFRIAPHGGGAAVFAAPRVVPLQGQSNLRDLGGYMTGDGREVRWGVVYRSGELSHMTAGDYATLDALHIRTVCDLRTGAERTSQPTRWPGTPVQTLVSPKPQLDSVLKPLLALPNPTAGDVRQMMSGFYRQMPDLYAEEYRTIFRQVLEGRTPLLIHCTAGKDRTGVAAAMILAALGVPRPTIDQDYQLTEQLQAPLFLPNATPAMAKLQALPPDVRLALMRADPVYVDAALDSLAQEYGSLYAYLKVKLGVGPLERLQLRQALLY